MTRFSALTSLSLLLLSCQSEAPPLQLRVDDEHGWEERRRRMDITVHAVDENGNVGPAEELDTSVFANSVLLHHCSKLTATNPSLVDCYPQPGDGFCRDQFCTAHLAICGANLALELSRAVSSTTLTGIGPDETETNYLVPPQPTATNAGLAEIALMMSQYAAVYAGENLRLATDDEYPAYIFPPVQQFPGIEAACTAVDLEEENNVIDELGGLQTGAESLAGILVEAAQLAERAGEQALRDNTAVADADLASTPNRGEGFRAAWMAPVLSRLRGMQFITGGAGYYDDPTEPTPFTSLEYTGGCVTSCDAKCRQAVDMMRDSGIAPGIIIDLTIPSEDLITTEGGLRDRLAERYQSQEVAAGTAQHFLDRFQVSEIDLNRARSHLLEEASFFHRDISIQAPRPILTTSDPGTPVVSQYDYFAATVRPPAPTPPLVHIAMARANVELDDDRLYGTASPVSRSAHPTAFYAQRGVSQLVDYAESVAQFVVSGDVLNDDAQDIAGVLLAQRIQSRSVRVEGCYRYSAAAGDELRVRVHGMDDEDSVAIVSGTSGLVCAETGYVEGEPCNLADYIVPLLTSTQNGHTDYGIGFDRYVEMTLYAPYPTDFRYYIVRRRTGSATSAAGNWEGLSSTTVHQGHWGSSPMDEWLFCHHESADQTLFQMVSKAMAADPMHCDDGPATDCYGAHRGRLPLEDELIDDSDPYENSFRHHIRVAREAADHADFLGQQLIEAGLAMDVRAETAAANLADICGGEFNLDGLFGVDGGALVPSLDQVVMDAPCGEGYVELGDRCILDIVGRAALSEADALALADCLGGDETHAPVVIVGSEPLCIWRSADTGSENILCEGASEALPCPSRIPDGGCPAPHDPENNTLISPEEQEVLGLFGEGGGTGYVEPLDCSLIRQARTTTGTARRHAIDAIVASNFFAIENVRYWAERIGWRGYPMNLSELTIDGGRWRGTGNPLPHVGGQGLQTMDWPCTAAAGIDCTGDSTSLFCSPVPGGCGSEDGRATINERLARAAMVVGIMSGNGLANMYLPAQYDSPAFAHYDLGGRSVVQDIDEDDWRFGTEGRWVSREVDTGSLSGLIAIPLSNPADVVWTRPARGDGQTRVDATSTLESPVGFINFGRAQSHEGGARHVTEAFWNGMAQGGGITLAGARPLAGFPIASSELVESADGRQGFFRLALEGAPVSLAGSSQSTRNSSFTHLWVSRTGHIGWPLNDLAILSSGVGRGDALDALELVCEAAHAAQDADFCDPSRPPRIQSPADLPQLRAYLRCVANKVERMSDRVILQNVPRRAIEMIQNQPGTIRPDEGAYGADVIQLRDSLRAMATIPRSIAAQVNAFADDLELLEIVLGNVEARRELQSLGLISGVLSQVAACASSGSLWGAIATCANGAAQIVIQFQMGEINQALLDSEQQQLLIEFRRNFADKQEILAQLSDQVISNSEQVNRSLTGLRSSRRAAARSLAGSLFASSDAGGRHFHVNTVMRRNYNTLRERYEEAHRAAIQYADLARRSLEQRLGTDLASLDLSLVDAPGELAMGICQSSGINYARIRDETEIELESYADAFVGDYVRRLERVLESYRLDYPYTSAVDTAVISVRDDLWTIREQCPAPTFNLLAASGDLTRGVEPLPDDGVPTLEDGVAPNSAWGAAGCVDLDVDPNVELIENCVTIGALTDAGSLSIDPIDDTHRRGAFRVTFAPDTGDSFDAAADWGQTLALGPSVYRLSWYGRCVDDGTSRAPSTAVELTVQGASGPVSVVSSAALSTTTPAACGEWTRYFRFFSFEEGGAARVRIIPATAVSTTHSIDIAAVQLEWVGDRVLDAVSGIDQTDVDGSVGLYYPRPFVATTSYETAQLMVCEDEDGDRFRRRWAYRCLPVCVAGVDDCAESELGTQHCYWETELNINLEGIEDRSILPNGGFAIGNFNYRVDQIALNFVGTGTRDCSQVGAPGTCHGAGFIPYSIYHLPPYTVRNYDGDRYEAPLFEGRIEHARGLASERYVTNPLSSSDQSMLSSYMRHELRGRPISGRFVVRVWDEPGVSFHNIEDVQIVMNYRYLTRTPVPQDL